VCEALSVGLVRESKLHQDSLVAYMCGWQGSSHLVTFKLAKTQYSTVIVGGDPKPRR
jgi:hypothetical protein